MQSKIAIGFLFSAVCFASTHAACKPEVGGTAESYLCEGIDDLKDLSTIPETAQRITIFNSKIPTLPGNSFARFGGTLVYLNITSSEVTEIHGGTFSGLTGLRDLILDNNNLKLLKTEWIIDLSNLKTLRLYHNHITLIEEEVYDHLPNLEILDLAYNEISNCLSTESLKKLGDLDIIYLTGNPWPLRCRPEVIFHLDAHHVQTVHTWGNSHILIAECLAHETLAQYNDDVLKECVGKLASKYHDNFPSSSSSSQERPVPV